MTVETKQTSFTPGPWEHIDGEVSTVGKPWAIVCNVNREEQDADENYGIVVGCGGSWEANAHLIQAAPDLYEAAKTARIQLQGRLDALAHVRNATWSRIYDALAVLDAAIAKADGR